MIAQVKYKVKLILHKILLSSFFSAVRLLVNKHKPESAKTFSDLVIKSNIFKVSNSDLGMISELKNIEIMYYNGDYHKAVAKRVEIYQEIYEKLDLDEKVFPKRLSNIWTSAIGHEAFIGVLQLCTRYGLMHEGKREIDLPKTKKSTLIALFDDFLDINYLNSPVIDVSNFPSNFHLYENLMLWRTKQNEFQDVHVLLERSFTEFDSDVNTDLFIFSESQEFLFYERLKAFGLPLNAWFVVVHVKETPKNTDPRRSASVENFIKSCEFIIDQGGWIIQVGFKDSTKLNLQSNFIDLRSNDSAITSLHIFVMAKAFFYLGTMTGFNVIAGLFKTPSLITNAVALGRNTLFYNSLTRYVPKTVMNIKENRKLAFSEILGTIEGFGDPSSASLLKKSLILIQNTPEEILDATADFHEMLCSNRHSDKISIDLKKQVDKIRGTSRFTSTGLFSEPYLVNNPDWLKLE